MLLLPPPLFWLPFEEHSSFLAILCKNQRVNFSSVVKMGQGERGMPRFVPLQHPALTLERDEVLHACS